MNNHAKSLRIRHFWLLKLSLKIPLEQMNTRKHYVKIQHYVMIL